MINRTNKLLRNLSFNDLREYIPHSNEMLAIKSILYKLFTFLENKDATINAGYINYSRGYGRNSGKPFLGYILHYTPSKDSSLSNKIYAYITTESENFYGIKLCLEGNLMMKYLADFIKKYFPDINSSLYIKGILEGNDLSRIIMDLYIKTNGYKPKTECDVLPLDIISYMAPKLTYTFLFPNLAIYSMRDKIKTQEFDSNNLKLFNILIDGIINGMKQL